MLARLPRLQARGKAGEGGLKIARDEAGRAIVEREIARRALEANVKLITLSNKGFSPLFKPSGRAFDSAGEGRLLMLAPAGWPYQLGEKKMTRFDACTLNRIAQLVAGEGAAEINYRGMKPGDITSRVAAACKVGLAPNPRDKAHP